MDDPNEKASAGESAKAKSYDGGEGLNLRQHSSADSGRAQAQGIANIEAVEFLQQLRRPPWILIAITLESDITSIAAHNVEEADAFITTHNNKDNLYYREPRTILAFGDFCRS